MDKKCSCFRVLENTGFIPYVPTLTLQYDNIFDFRKVDGGTGIKVVRVNS